MSDGVRKNEKKKTYSSYLYLVRVKDVCELATQAAVHKQTLNKTNHKLAEHPF
jgi:hypothetical protein